MKYKQDEAELALLMESIYSGKVEKNKDTDDDEKDDTEDVEKEVEDTEEEDSEEKDEKKEKDSKDEDSDDEDDEDKSKGKDDGEESSAKEKSPAKSKLKTLQRQYNDLLIDLFDKFSVECIESALEDSEAAFGENIQDILDSALASLKDKILDELGVENDFDDTVMPPEAMGSFDPDAAPDLPLEIEI